MQKRQLDEFIMEEGNFTMDFLEKINMKDILGDMLFTENAATEKMVKGNFTKGILIHIIGLPTIPEGVGSSRRQ